MMEEHEPWKNSSISSVRIGHVTNLHDEEEDYTDLSSHGRGSMEQSYFPPSLQAARASSASNAQF